MTAEDHLKELIAAAEAYHDAVEQERHALADELYDRYTEAYTRAKLFMEEKRLPIVHE